MGGDHAPAAIVEGAVRARRELNLEVILVGQEEKIRAELAQHGASDEIPVHHASEVVAMDEPPM
ncbi:MAG: phosphate acyltransferase, partial [Deltaproteobacteria bacterium]|nr:phosphate acyltransferase [Deltaproteobacteria bacterium]